MRRDRLMWMAACAMFVLATASNAAAQKITEQRLQELIREAAERVGVAQTPNAATGQTPTTSDRPVVHLSMDDAVKLALDPRH